MDPEADKTTTELPMGGFKSSLHTLVTARASLICREFKSALRDRTRAITSLIVAVMLAFFSWALLLAGSIAALSIATGWPWHLVTLCLAALHLMTAIMLLKAATNSAKSDPFPLTRSEFQKDCEWLQSLQKDPKSKS